jgi:threonylcarbamoyladenosine tRNA methylthiotransferase MtaB
VDDAGLTFLHVFPYSARKGTPAARMPQLNSGVIKERAARLRDKGDAALAARNASLVGTTQTLLMEKSNLGRTGCFMPVRYTSISEPGAFVNARITHIEDNHLIAA